MAASPSDRPRIARALWAYSLLSQEGFAAQAGIHKDRMRAILGRVAGKEPTEVELTRMADVVGVPLRVALGGFGDDDPVEDIRRLWQEVARQRSDIDRLVSVITEPDLDQDAIREALREILRASQGLSRTAEPPAEGRGERDRPSGSAE